MLNNIIIAFNTYALYFVRRFWLNDGNHSEAYKIGSSLSILMVAHFAWIRFISYQMQFNWKAVIFFVCIFHLLVSIVFNKNISNLVEKHGSKRFKRYYLFFVAYLLISVVLLFIDIFYY